MNDMIELASSKRLQGIESSLLNSLQGKGYTYDFRLQKDNQLLCLQNNKTFSGEKVKVGLADLCYDYTTHDCKYVHTIDSACGIKGLLVAEKIYLPDREIIGRVIEKYNELTKVPEIDNIFPGFNMLAKKNPAEDRILVRFKDKIIPVLYNDIALFFLEHELVQLVTFDGRSYFVQRSLEDLEKHLGINFYRVNRQSLINKAAIKDLSTSFTRTITVNLKCQCPHKIVVSKLKSSNFLDWLTLNPAA
jgi:hypothetical protein